MRRKLGYIDPILSEGLAYLGFKLTEVHALNHYF